MANQNSLNVNSSYPDWADAEKGKVYVSIFNQINDFDRTIAGSIISTTLAGLRQYSNRGTASLHSSAYMTDVDVNSQLGMSPSVMRVAFNLTAAVIDTLTAKLASIQATPQAVTNKGNTKGRKLAEDINFVIKGLYHKYDLSHLLNLAFRDAMINRVGYLKVVKEDGEIRVDRVLADEIIVDPADAYYNMPYKMLHRKAIPLHVMIKKYPQHEMQLRDCKVQEVKQYNTRNYTPCITVAEAWCKNTYMKGGRHVITVETMDLLDEEWNKDYFPVVKCDYSEPVIGWMGNSVTDELESIQKEIDRIMFTMQAIMRLVSVPRVFVDTNAQVNKNHITNKVGIIVEYDGKQGVAPIIHNGAAMPPELPKQLEFLIAQGYARAGLTTQDTQGMKPAGVDSGEALKTLNEQKSERWQMLQHNYEQKHVDLAQVILNELAGTNIKLSALDRFIGLKEISTKKIPKTQDSYILQVFPVSSLPDTIPELIDSVEKLSRIGVIQPSQIPELFQMPDLDAYVAMQAAPRKLIDKKMEQMLDTGIYWAPEPYYDLNYALGTALQQYSWAQLNDASDKDQGLLRRFINDVRTLLSQVPQPAPTQGVNNVGANQQPASGANPSGAPSPSGSKPIS
jgi:hypothetical protein